MEKENRIIRRDDGRGRPAVLTYAQEHGYTRVLERGKWDGKQIYEPLMSEEGEDGCIGIPQFIIDDGERLRFSDVDEAFSILDSFA